MERQPLRIQGDVCSLPGGADQVLCVHQGDGKGRDEKVKRFALYLPAALLLLTGIVVWALFLLPASQAYPKRQAVQVYVPMEMSLKEEEQEARLQRVRAEAVREVAKFASQQRYSK